MAETLRTEKKLSLNPLKISAPVGAGLAVMGISGALPLLHGGQGCAAFAKVLQVRHFNEPSPFQTTAINEIDAILGGMDNLEQGCLNVVKRTGCSVIGVISTGLAETRGEDLAGDLRLIKARNPGLAEIDLIPISAPDFSGSLEDGWGIAAKAMVETLARPATVRNPRQINILPPSYFTAADIEELRETVEAFDLAPVILPDISRSLDGHAPDRHIGHSYGGAKREEIALMGSSELTVAIGEQMRAAAESLHAITGVPNLVLDRLTGLSASDFLISHLQFLSGRPPPPGLQRRRSQLVDAMLDGHFYFGGVRAAVAAEADLLFAYCAFLSEMGADIRAAIAASSSSSLKKIPIRFVRIGDIEDLEREAEKAGVEIIFSHSHAAQAAQRLNAPLCRIGFPIFDRIGVQHQGQILYRGTRETIYRIANLLNEEERHPAPEGWAPSMPAEVKDYA